MSIKNPLIYEDNRVFNQLWDKCLLQVINFESIDNVDKTKILINPITELSTEILDQLYDLITIELTLREQDIEATLLIEQKSTDED